MFFRPLSLRAISHAITIIILDILNNCRPMDCINKTGLILILKKKNPATPLDFCPISRCNVIYKLPFKMLVNRMKHVVPIVVSDT